MKVFTTLKVGYTAGIYGCSNEFFTTIYTTKDGLESLHFKGMYGAAERVKRAFEAKGYKENYSNYDYGRMKAREVMNIFKYENEAIKFIEENL